MRERSMALSDIADRGRLLQAAGHDTRQALFALKQFAAGLQKDAGPERIDTAQQSITQLAKHVDDVLATHAGWCPWRCHGRSGDRTGRDCHL